MYLAVLLAPGKESVGQTAADPLDGREEAGTAEDERALASMGLRR